MTKASKKSENRKLFLSHYAGIQKRKRLLPAYDNVIEQRNAQHTKCYGKMFCYLPILLRGENIPVRVIVRNNTGRRTVFQGNLCSTAHIHIHTVDNTAADFFAKRLRPVFKNNLLGPEYPVVSRVKNQYIKQILIKFDRNDNSNKIKELLKSEIESFKRNNDYKAVSISIDIDPI